MRSFIQQKSCHGLVARGWTGGYRPLIGGGFYNDISDDAAATRGKVGIGTGERNGIA